MPRLHLTAHAVERLPYAVAGQVTYTDTKHPGFGLVVGRRSKTYFYQRDVAGRTVRVTLGRAEEMKNAAARTAAKAREIEMRGGHNPNAKTQTLREALAVYEAALTEKNRSPRTATGYRKSLERYLADWLDKDLADISRQMVYDRHRKIGTESGRYAANGTMRAFRAVYRHAMRRHERLPAAPTVAVDWYREQRRKAAIPEDKLGTWYAEAADMVNPIRRDYLLFCLFTGMRREAAAAVRREHVHLEQKLLHVPRPKGGAARAFNVPLSDFLVELLRRRMAENEPFFPKSPWVFPAHTRKGEGHIVEPREVFKNVPFTVHGLRDTYITAAHRAGVSKIDVKLLVNHALPNTDVTEGYIAEADALDYLRPLQQSVTDRLRKLLEPATAAGARPDIPPDARS
jgi:integrase